MDKKLLNEILSIPSYFGREERVKEFLITYANKNNIKSIVDEKGNVYLIKGELSEGEYYPCVLAHIDTVHDDQIPLIETNGRLKIYEESIGSKTKLWASLIEEEKEVLTGIGGDDKAGVAICLEILKTQEKLICGFFVEEEIFCRGSAMADEEILKNVGYFIQFDAPHDNWCSFTSNKVQLFNEETFNVLKPILEDYGIDNISVDPYTDVFRLKGKFDVVCLNFFAGYYKMHTSQEYVIVEDIEKAISLGNTIINTFGLNKKVMVNENKLDSGLITEIINWKKGLNKKIL